MKHICIIGDSHITALKAGWNLLRNEINDIELTFFGGLNKYLDALNVESGALIAEAGPLRDSYVRTSGGVARIEASYDVYVLCGLKLDAFPITRVPKEFAHTPEGVKALVIAACRRIGESPLAGVLRKLRQCTRAKTLLVATPFQVKDGRKIWAQITPGRSAFVARVFDRACHRYAKQMGCVYIPQPMQTRGSTRVDTRAKFAKSPARLGGGDDDNIHMNAEFGSIVLKAIFAALAD